MSGVTRLTITALGTEPRAAALLADARALGLTAVTAIRVSDLVFLDGPLGEGDRELLADLLVDSLLQVARWEVPSSGQAIETELQPGVTDPIGHEIVRVAALLGVPVRAAASGHRFEIDGELTPADLERLAGRLLANPVIERWAAGAIEPPFRAEIPALVPPEVVAVIGLTPEELTALDRSRGLALDPAELAAVQAHFTAEGRDPTDVELETIAQTWSEHCAHKTFRARLTTTDGRELTPLLPRLRATTDHIAAPFVRSSFVGNAGIVSFEPGRTLALKAETHNHPSAVEPFGGANTGVGGVIRDVIGAGHHPIACTDVLCFGPADLDPSALPDGVLHPRLIRSGVVAGVADYGNKIGLPTVAGAVLYDPGFTANPLVFCGCIGVAEERAPLTGPHAGDRIVALGGRTGRDGLRGATFSSATMDATTGEVAGASVQIGDPITEKLVMDLLSDAHGLYTGITDCGAGGFSSAIGEMAEGVGARVELTAAPLKYPGLSAWEIWLSEAQERMVVSVGPDRMDDLRALSQVYGVELTDLGEFTGDGRLVVTFAGTTVLDLDTEFLHDGRPQRSMTAEMPRPVRTLTAPGARHVDDPAAALLALLAHPNIASKADIVHRYDHEIRGATAIRPLTGPDPRYGTTGPGDGVVIAEPGESFGFAIGIGVNPWHGLHDPERMAAVAVDEAIRNVVAAGADPERVALLDNFSWGDPRRPSTLGSLVAAVEGCCSAAEAFEAPFVSGKDSLNNEYFGADGERHAVPPTLVITAVAHVPDVASAPTPALHTSGDLLVLLGSTAEELAGSHLDLVLGAPPEPGVVPAPDPSSPDRYRGLHLAIRAGLVRACHDVSEGGLGVALAEMCLGSGLGAEIAQLPDPDPVVGLFSESSGRFVVEVAVADLDDFRALVPGAMTVLGRVTALAELTFPGVRPLPLAELDAAWSPR